MEEMNSTTTVASPSEGLATLRVMTYNCLGLKFISHHRRARLREIGRAISLLSPPPQIVGLQECWTQEDYASIRRQTSVILPYGKFYFSGIFGGGLAILSAFPIEETSMYRYPLNGRPTAFFRGDWFVGKGVACARIRLSTPMPTDDMEKEIRGERTDNVVEVFCTHLHAPYEAEPGDSYLCHRTAQAWEIAKLMRGAADRGHLVLGLGDFNMLPLSLAHRVITARGGVVDAWHSLHPDSSLGPVGIATEKGRGRPVPTARFNLEVNGAASDNVLNTWRWKKADQKAQYGAKAPVIEVPWDTPDPHAKRLDYIFVGGNGAVNSDAEEATMRPSTHGPHHSCRWDITEMKVGMTQLHPTIHCSLSDHFSVHLTLTNRRASTNTTFPRQRTSIPPPVASPPPPPPSNNNKNETKTLTKETYPQILVLIHTYTARETLQRILRLCHFLFWLLTSIACFIGIWFIPCSHAYGSFLLILVSTIGVSIGVVDGLIGGLFMSSEIRALREFEWEVENAAALSENGGGRGG